MGQICANTNVTKTNGELYAQTIRVAKNLQKCGCKKGEVIFFLTKNSADIPAIVFAALCLGCPITGSGEYNTTREHLYFLNVVKPKYVFCDVEYYEELNDCHHGLNDKPIFFTFGGQTRDSRSIEVLFEVDNANSISDFM